MSDTSHIGSPQGTDGHTTAIAVMSVLQEFPDMPFTRQNIGAIGAAFQLGARPAQETASELRRHLGIAAGWLHTSADLFSELLPNGRSQMAQTLREKAIAIDTLLGVDRNGVALPRMKSLQQAIDETAAARAANPVKAQCSWELEDFEIEDLRSPEQRQADDAGVPLAGPI